MTTVQYMHKMASDFTDLISVDCISTLNECVHVCICVCVCVSVCACAYQLVTHYDIMYTHGTQLQLKLH